MSMIRARFALLSTCLALGLLAACASQPATFTITYDANGGSNPPIDDAVYTTGSIATVRSGAGLVRVGDTFLHWNTESDGSGVTYPPGSSIVAGTSDIVLYAAWLSETPTFTITYDANGGSGPPVDGGAYATGSTLVVLPPGAMGRDAYSYFTWNTQPDGNGDTLLEGDTITVGTNDITLYALWRPHFFLAENGVTVMCPDAAVGDTGTVGGAEYTKRTREQIIGDRLLAATSCTSGITDMSEMFFLDATGFNEDIGAWDTSNVTDMRGMFHVASTFNRDIGAWDTSSVTDMSAMFREASSFDQPLGAWDTSNVTNMDVMFQFALAFDRDLSGWCVEKILSQPLLFDQAAVSWTQPRPVWGTCPP